MKETELLYKLDGLINQTIYIIESKSLIIKECTSYSPYVASFLHREKEELGQIFRLSELFGKDVIEAKYYDEIADNTLAFIDKLSNEEIKTLVVNFEFTIKKRLNKINFLLRIVPYEVNEFQEVVSLIAVLSIASGVSSREPYLCYSSNQSPRNYVYKKKKWTLFSPPQLSGRMKEVLTCGKQGMTEKEIADRLCISLSTVKLIKKELRQRLDAPSFVAAIVTATNYCLI